MRKTGILFQGLQVWEREPAARLEEEGSYGGVRLPVQDGGFLDVTYFILYAMCQNVRCREKIRDMKKEWRIYLEQNARRSIYQGEYFWGSLGYEEYPCAQAILGMLEDIRGREDERCEKAWISFWYLLHCGFREDCRFLDGKAEIPFVQICENARNYKNWQFMGISQICIVLLEAENRGILVRPDEKYRLLCRCAGEGNQLWESTGEEVGTGLLPGERKEHQKEFRKILESTVQYPDRIFSGVREKEEEKFESYLQTLFRMGGIDRNVIAGEVLSTEKVGEMIEAGKFQGKEDLEPYLYSLAILLLSQYVKKCLNKLKAMEKGEKR
ncbi:MAG TPA: hypothetical protein H9753_11200 [Candidatus Blautia merdavium]|uniref:Uncharacterized protein n=1 Tax=Candidatus Blautia merdavium TaxID=2838494 RepID=A0A9D2TCM2_9FIRM|nr:hypothetical protein [Candidatus Blautia merdavium]